MSDKKQGIKQALKTYYAEKSLSGTQLESLQAMLEASQPLNNNRHSALYSRHWLGAMAASVLLFAVLFISLHTPAVISDAYADLKGDAGQHNGMQASLSRWLLENRIAAVPAQYPVEMSKLCMLDRYQTTHLRIAGVEQGKLHLFFHRGKRPIHWLNRSGSMDNMNWQLHKVRDDLTLIVLYTHDMREKAVKHILAEVLPEFQA